ncbi:MAG: Uma2 family endonuclease [Aestuariivita sp.]|nr:Uma2 family endonuclease [Aestuariivita sp.]
MTTSANPHHLVGSMGSDFWRITVPPQLIPEFATKIDWNQIGRRVMIDAIDGIIVMMSPSSSHEVLGHSSDIIVMRAGNVLQKQVRCMRGTRWKRPEDSENVGLEADTAFYIGETATAWYTAFRNGGRKAAENFEARTPPDLVVEVEVTHFEKNKPDRYARLGVREMWRVDVRTEHDQPQIEILALQQPNSPKVVNTSSVLGKLPTSVLPHALWLATAGDEEKLKNY